MVAYESQPDALNVIKDYAASHGNPLRVTDFGAIQPVSADLKGQSFQYKNKEYTIRLLGAHQQRNAALVLETVAQLRELGWSIGEDCVVRGMAEAQWPARFELLCEEPIVFVDGAHNLQGVESLQKAVEDYLGGRRVICLTGVLADKDWQEMMALLRSVAAEFITITPDSPRALTNEALAEYLRGTGAIAHAAESVSVGMDMALERARETDSVIVVCGSLYMASEVREYFGRNV